MFLLNEENRSFDFVEDLTRYFAENAITDPTAVSVEVGDDCVGFTINDVIYR